MGGQWGLLVGSQWGGSGELQRGVTVAGNRLGGLQWGITSGGRKGK